MKERLKAGRKEGYHGKSTPAKKRNHLVYPLSPPFFFRSKHTVARTPPRSPTWSNNEYHPTPYHENEHKLRAGNTAIRNI